MTPELEPRDGLLTMGLIALLGGIARQSHQWLSGKKVTWRHFVFRALISFFIGMVCSYAFPLELRDGEHHHAPWAFATVGLLSWMGADGVALLLKLFTTKNNGND